jgi:hypothetical protein
MRSQLNGQGPSLQPVVARRPKITAFEVGSTWQVRTGCFAAVKDGVLILAI